MISLIGLPSPDVTSTIGVVNTLFTWGLWSNTVIYIIGFLFGILVLGFVISRMRK